MALLYDSQNIHLLSKSLHQVNVLETVLLLFNTTLYTLIANHNFVKNTFFFVKKFFTNNFILRQEIITWRKGARNDVCHQFLAFLVKS